MSEILQCLEKTRAIHLDRSYGYKIRRTNIEDLSRRPESKICGSGKKNKGQDLFLK
jgi:hypothetical protein